MNYTINNFFDKVYLINLINNSTTPVKFYHYDKCNLGLPIGRIEKVDQSN